MVWYFNTSTEDVLNWVLSDYLGSSSVTAQADGTWNGEIRYSAFGETRYSSGITPTDYRYTGQMEEKDLGLYYYVSRWYDPSLGRFIQADTVVPDSFNPQDWNRYTYTRNNPLSFNDPDGHNPFLSALIGAAVGGMINAIGYFATNLQTFDSNEYWTAVGTGTITGAILGSGIGIVGSAAAGTTAHAIASGLIGGGSAATFTEVEYMVTSINSFETEEFVQNTAISGAIGGISSALPLNPVGVIGKGVVYIGGSEVQYALQTDQWTVEGAQEAAMYGAIGAMFDVGFSYYAQKCFLVDTPNESIPVNKSSVFMQEVQEVASIDRLRTTVTNIMLEMGSSIGSTSTIHNVRKIYKGNRFNGDNSAY